MRYLLMPNSTTLESIWSVLNTSASTHKNGYGRGTDRSRD